MRGERWLEVIGRISGDEPLDLDPILIAAAPTANLGAPPDPAGSTVRSSKLWSRDDAVSYIGVRVDEPPRDLPRIALRLASAAEERGVVPIILSTLARTGLEQFGFRVERLPEGPPEAMDLFEAELRKFWDMPIVISLSDVERLG